LLISNLTNLSTSIQYTKKVSKFGKKIMSQHEYIAHMEDQHTKLKEAWGANGRILTLKIAIQCAKLLGDTSVPTFYPSMYSLLTMVLDTFGDLVFQRIKSRGIDLGQPRIHTQSTKHAFLMRKCSHISQFASVQTPTKLATHVGGGKAPTALPNDFQASDVCQVPIGNTTFFRTQHSLHSTAPSLIDVFTNEPNDSGGARDVPKLVFQDGLHPGVDPAVIHRHGSYQVLPLSARDRL
jgi:hypothetical protein